MTGTPCARAWSGGASIGDAPSEIRAVPILLYHSVDNSPPSWIAPFAVRTDVFTAHLDLLVSLGCHPLTVSGLVDRLTSGGPWPERPIVITFDDGFADTAEVAAPALFERGLPATVYVTTGALSGDGPTSEHRLPPARMMSWDQLGGLERMGIEVGAHTETHRPLDLLPEGQVNQEVRVSKARLERALHHRVRTFAYPYGYYDRYVSAVVRRAGFDSACAVKNGLSSTADDQLALARLTITSSTNTDQLGQWMCGQGAAFSSPRRQLRQWAWRQYRWITSMGGRL